MNKIKMIDSMNTNFAKNYQDGIYEVLALFLLSTLPNTEKLTVI